MQIDNARNININIKSPNFYGEVIALLDRYTNMIKKRTLCGDEKDKLIQIKKMIINNAKLTDKQRENTVLRINRLLNILGYPTEDVNNIISINDTLFDFSSPIIYVTIKNLLDNYIYDITEKRIFSIDNPNDFIKLREMISASVSLTVNQKNQLVQKVDRLLELLRSLKEGITINEYDFYSDATSIVDSYINLVNKNTKLKEDDKNNLNNIKTKVINNNALTIRQKEQLLKKISKIMFLAFTPSTLPPDRMIHDYNNQDILDYNEVLNFLVVYTRYLENNKDKVDFLSTLDNLINLSRKIGGQKLFSDSEKHALNDKIVYIIDSFYEKNDIINYLTRIINTKEITIGKIVKLLHLLQEKYFNELLAFFACNDKIDKELNVDIANNMNFSLKVRYFGKCMSEIINGEITDKLLKEFLFIINASKVFKLININNVTTFENVLCRLKRILKDDNNKEYSSIIKEIIGRMEEIINYIKENTVIYDIVLGKVDFKRDNSNINIILPYKEKDYPLIQDECIITIDEENVKDLDTAFSIKKVDEVYVLSIYVTDVPNVLLHNRELAQIAYNNATSYYLHNFHNYSIDMLPTNLSHNVLSLNKNGLKNVITFKFWISNNGDILDTKVFKNRILVNVSLDHQNVSDILKSKNIEGTKKDLELLKNLCMLIKLKDERKHLKGLKDNDLVALTSLLPNYYVGETSSLAIYRDKGLYTKEKVGYTHSVTPLRRIVSDINLGLFLNQLGLMNISDKDIHLIEDNLDEIIEHLNKKEQVGMYVNSHSNTMQKFLKL